MSVSASHATLADAFRGAMRCFAASVSILAVRKGERRGGTTVTAACSVSAAPPSLLVCINRSASAWELLRNADAFSLNILGADDAALANVFAGRTEARRADARFAFAETRWREHPMGPPVLEGALATMICRATDWLESGSHSIVIGAVKLVVQGGRSQSPLVYAHGSYHRLTPRP